MGMYEFFFPEQAEAEHLRSISRTLAVGARKGSKSGRKVSGLSEDVGFLALILLSVVRKLTDKGVITREELADHFRELDGLDGVADGKISSDVLRGALGISVPLAPKSPARSRARRSRFRR